MMTLTSIKGVLFQTVDSFLLGTLRFYGNCRTVYAGKSELWANISFIIFYRKESKASLFYLQG